jgi:hypothetical protein
MLGSELLPLAEFELLPLVEFLQVLKKLFKYA